MKGVNWIEFLVSFGIFTIIVIFIFNFILGSYSNILQNFLTVDSFQRFLYISLIKIKGLEFIQPVYFEEFYTPIILFLDNSTTSCNNCISIYYNTSGKYVVIKQNGNYNSNLEFIVFSYGNFSNSGGSCMDYIDLIDLPNRNLSVYLCKISLNNNDIFYFYNVEPYLIIQDIRTTLFIYNGGYNIYKISSVASPYSNFYFIYSNKTVQKVTVIT